jgi:sodium-independent sulfate anion transporter 11
MSNSTNFKENCIDLYANSKKSAKKGFKRAEIKFPEYVRSLVPIATWIRKYQPQWLVGDIVAGLTVGAMIVPQALAYSKLTGLSSQYALYSSLMGGIVYAFFGTCRETSLGPTAVVSLVLGQSIQQVQSQTNFTAPEIASVFCIICALISLILGVLKLGFLLELVSHPVVLGFTTGSAFTIMLSQVPGLFGIPNVNTNQMSHLVIGNIFSNIRQLGWVNLVFGLSSLLFLLTCNFATARLRKYSVIQYLSIATIGVTVIIFTVIGYIVKLNYPELKMNLVGDVPSGIKFTVPSSSPSLWLKVFPLAIPLTLIMLMENLAIMKTFSKRGGYSVSSSQEMVALGMVNLVGTFFSAFPVSGALSRCAVLSKAGARSPLAGGFTGVVAILAVMVLTPAFKYIPLPTLAAVIMIAASKLIMGWEEITDLFQIDKLDFSLCILCALLTFFLGSELGIYISVGLSFLILIVRIAHPKLSILYKVLGDGDHFEDRKNVYFDSENPEPGVIIFRPKESLLFPNIENFKEAMMSVVLEETASLAAPIPAKDKPWSDDLLSKGERLRALRSRKMKLPKAKYSDLPPLKAIIMDMTGVNRIDASGLQGLRDFKEQCESYSGQNSSTRQITSKGEEDSSVSVGSEQFVMIFVTTNIGLIEKLKNSSLLRSRRINNVQKEEIDISSADCYHTIGSALNTLLTKL